jgi:hypothetical protein
MVAVVLAGFSADRPQLFSLLMFSLLVLVLELAAHRRALQWLILPLLVLWTNLHQAVPARRRDGVRCTADPCLGRAA